MDNKVENLLRYHIDDYSDEQIFFVKLALKYSVDPSLLCNPKFHSSQMRQILYGLIQNVDVIRYYDLNFSPGQMEQIRIGLYNGIDISIYASYSIKASEMVYIRHSLEREVYGSVCGKHHRKPEVNKFDINVKVSNLVKKLEYPTTLDFDNLIQNDMSLDDLFKQGS